MRRTVTALDARRRLGELLESVYHRGDEVIIERAGKPMAVVIPAARYEAMERNRERLFAMIDQVHERNKDAPVEIIQADVDEAIAKIRKQAAPRTSP
ncbi:MAG: type II toxin-antitoxin system Phd/YefM family antitoxin [Tepidiformaceae bacterium]